jgi:hypothetical protein
MNSEVTFIAAPLLAIAFFIVGLFFFRAYTGLRRETAFLALVGSCIVAGIYPATRLRELGHLGHPRGPETIFPVIAAGACIVFLTALVLRLWGRWIGDKATPAELQLGKPGVHAWFSAGNVAVGVIIVVTAWYGFDISPLLTAVVLCAVFAAFPVIRMEIPTTTNTPASTPPTDGHSPEREKIVAMLEAGKLTPDESAELLQALSEKPQSAARQVPLTSGQRFMLIGAALVALGFFLPWIVFNPGKEMGRMMNQLESTVNTSMPETFRNSMNMSGNFSMPNMELKTGSVSVSGGDIGRGLGWAALGLAIAAAVLPYVGTSLDAHTTRTLRFLCLGLGALIILYLLTQNLRYVGVGLVVVLSGYALEFVGALRERGPQTA